MISCLEQLRQADLQIPDNDGVTQPAPRDPLATPLPGDSWRIPGGRIAGIYILDTNWTVTRCDGFTVWYQVDAWATFSLRLCQWRERLQGAQLERTNNPREYLKQET